MPGAGGPSPRLVAERRGEVSVRQQFERGKPEQRSRWSLELGLIRHRGWAIAGLPEHRQPGYREEQKWREDEQPAQGREERQGERARLGQTDPEKPADVPTLIARIVQVFVAGLKRTSEAGLMVEHQRDDEGRRTEGGQEQRLFQPGEHRLPTGGLCCR